MYTEMKNPSIQIEDGDRGKNYPSSNNCLERGYCLFLNNKNIINNKLNLNDAQYITEEKHNILGKKNIYLNDLVLTTRGILGNALIFNKKEFLSARINSGMVIIKPNKDFISKFLYFYFQSDFFKIKLKK